MQQAVAGSAVQNPSAHQKQLVAALDAASAEQWRAVVCPPLFQEIEALWRSVDLRARTLDEGDNVRLLLVDASKEELAAAQAAFLGLAPPRFLLRQPYGKGSDPIEAFPFEEVPGPEAHEAYLWGNPAVLIAQLRIERFKDDGCALSPTTGGDVGGLPVHHYKAGGESHVKPCAEAWLVERAATAIQRAGLIPVLSVKNRDAVRVVRLHSIAGEEQPLPLRLSERKPSALRTPFGRALTAARAAPFARGELVSAFPMASPASLPDFPVDDFRHGLRYLGADPTGALAAWTAAPAIDADATALPAPLTDAAAWQTALAADALRYLTLQAAATKASGHPGGFCSSAEAVAALFLLGHKTVFTEVGHHAPGYYSALFLDGSLEAMGIRTVADFAARFREQHGLLGHLSGAIPGVPAPAGPLGQGQHFAWAAARLHPDQLCPVTIGDGGMGEPYVMSAFKHYHVAFPEVTNVLPILVWNGFSQEHHSMVCTHSDAQMIAYWRAHEFDEVVLVDAARFNDSAQTGVFVDSTEFSPPSRVAFARAVVEGLRHAAALALRERRRTVFILKQLKGAGSHSRGAKSHHLYPQFTLEHPDMIAGLQRRALSAHAWALVRTNFRRAAGGPAGRVALTETTRPLPPLPELPVREFAVGNDVQIPASALSPLVAAVGAADPDFIVTSADGNEASGVRGVNDALKIRHPIEDPLYAQSPTGRVFEPISEDACAGLAAATALMGARSLWFSYESFAVNGLPFFQTVTQAMAELRRLTPSTIALFTAGALEQGRNGWTHQRPEIEAYFMALARNGNVHPLFPLDANCLQAAYAWAVATSNQGIALFGCKTAIPVRLTLAQSRAALARGAIALHETAPRAGAKLVVLAVCGDLALGSALDAAAQLEAAGHRVRVVGIVAPRRLYRPADVATHQIALPAARDEGFLDDAGFNALFAGDALLGIAAGASATLEPVLVRSRAARRDLVAWRRGETTAGPGPLLAYNDLDPASLARRAAALLD